MRYVDLAIVALAVMLLVTALVQRDWLIVGACALNIWLYVSLMKADAENTELKRRIDWLARHR